MTEETDERELTDEQFLAALETLDRVDESLEGLEDAIGKLDTGLTRSDTVALIYGRRNGLNKTTIEEAFQTLEDVRAKNPRELVVRLLSIYSDLNIGEAEEFLSELETLRSRYGGAGE